MSDIAVSVPSLGHPKIGFLGSLVAMFSSFSQSNPGNIVRFHQVKGSLLLQNRHDLVKMAKEAGSSHMLWLDDDMTFPHDTLARLLAHKKPIIGVNYVTKEIPALPNCAKNGRYVTSAGKKGLEAVDHIGMGVVLVDMKVFDALEKPWFYVGWKPSDEEYVGEDVYFCRMARKAGFDIWIDHALSNEVAHVGDLEFTHDLVEQPKRQIIIGAA